jgi:hypothetical protein
MSLRSSGQSSWLQIQTSELDSQRYQISWEAVGLERGPLSLVSKTEALLERESSGSGLKNPYYGRRDPPRWLRYTPLSTKVGINFSDKRRSLGRYSSLADSGHGVFCFCFCFKSIMPIERCMLFLIDNISAGTWILQQQFQFHENKCFKTFQNPYTLV